MNLKEKLFELDLVVDNEYLSKYCKLIDDNALTEKIKYKTQCHHIVPKCYYNYYNIDIDDSKDNKVHLLYKNHLKAHYYLSQCAKEDWFRYGNLTVLFVVAKKYNKTVEEIVGDVDTYQQLYEDTIVYYSSNEEASKKRSNAQRNRWASMDEEYRSKVLSNVSKGIQNYYDNGGEAWCKGLTKETSTSVKMISDKLIGHKPFGNLVEIMHATKGQIYVYDHIAHKSKRIDRCDLEKYLELGYSKTKWKTIQMTNGYETINNILPEEEEKYIKLGYWRGHNHKTSDGGGWTWKKETIMAC